MSLPLFLALAASTVVGTTPQSTPQTPPSAPAQDLGRLVGPRWRVTELGAKPVSVDAGPREPHLVFHATGSVTGADGCNTLRGGYVLKDDRLTFAALLGTLMACPALDNLDRRFLDALGSTRRWRASDTELTLLDDKQAVVARFAARP